MTNPETTIVEKSYTQTLWYTDKEIELVKNTVAKGTDNMELAYFLSLCKQHDLSPFKKEIRCYKDNRWNLLTMVGRDGMLKKAQSSWTFVSLNSIEVCKNDEFSIDIFNEKIDHKMTWKDRWDIIWAYAILKTSDWWITIQWADINVYDKKQFVWNSHKAEMIKKVAEMLCLKKKFIFSGLTIEESEWGKKEKNISSLSSKFTTNDISTTE